MRINDKETLALTDAVKSVMGENAKDYKPNRGGKGHDDFIDLHSIDKEKRRGSSPLTEKDIEEANEFTKAAAKAAVAGDKEFEFDGKTYPSEMDVDVAKKILGESVSVNEAKSNKERQDAIADVIAKHPNRSLADYGRMLFKNTAFKNKKFTKDEIRLLSKVQKDKKGNIAGMGKSPYPPIYNSTELDEAIDWSRVKDDQLKAWLNRFKLVKGNPWDGYKDDVKAAEKEAKKRGLDEAVVYQQNLPQILKKVETYLEFIEKPLSVGSKANKMVNRDLEGNYNKEFKKMEDALGVIFSEMDEIAMAYAMSESVELDESVNDIAKKVKQLKVGDKTNFGVVTAISNKSITFKAKDTPKTEIEFKQRKIGSRDFILDKLVKLTPDGKGVAKESAELEEALDAADGAMKGIKAKERLNYIDNIVSTYEGKDLNFYKKILFKNPRFKDKKLTPYELKVLKRAMKESVELEEAKFWTVTITKKTGKLFKGQTVDVKANNSAQAIEKGLTQMKVNPKLVPSNAVDATLAEELEEANIEEASNADLKKVLATAKKIGGRVKGNTADFGMGAVIDFSIEKGKIKFDGGKSSGIEYFDNVNDAISSLTAGLD